MMIASCNKIAKTNTITPLTIAQKLSEKLQNYGYALLYTKITLICDFNSFTINSFSKSGNS